MRQLIDSFFDVVKLNFLQILSHLHIHISITLHPATLILYVFVIELESRLPNCKRSQAVKNVEGKYNQK